MLSVQLMFNRFVDFINVFQSLCWYPIPLKTEQHDSGH